MPWVTINHKHVLIGEDIGHLGQHNPATHTGDKTTDRAVRSLVFERPEKKLIILEDLRVPKGERGKGLGTKFMNELTAKADKTGSTIILSTASKTPGETISSGRLKKFYKRFGFVENASKRDYRPDLPGTMHRSPKK